MQTSRSADLKKYLWLIVLIWTAGVAASLGWNLYQLDEAILRLARTSASMSFDKDLLYRRWAAEHGGVYVPVSEGTQPNPYLQAPNRDVVTSAGSTLTLVNPAYMTRQVNDLAAAAGVFRGHITSLNPIRPENRPDSWEAEALKRFEQGAKEAESVESTSGNEYFRFMRPFATEKSCLKCHAAQGYKEGDIRGGISVSIPMKPLRQVQHQRMGELTGAHGFLWAIGLIGIAVGACRLRSQTLLREKFEKELHDLSITDPLTGLNNRRGFMTLAEQQLKLSDRSRRGVQLYFADLDGLKWINDTLGHEEGDRALVETADLLREAFRSSDILARLGGDEFAVLAMDSENSSPELLLGRVQAQVERRNRQENRKYRLSISVGCAVYAPDHPCSIDELLAWADQRMYEEKKSRKGVSGQAAAPASPT